MPALSHVADAERALEDCSSCLVRDVIVSEAQAAEHSRSIVDAKNALLALRGQIRREHEEVCRHFQDAQLRFLQSSRLSPWLQVTLGVLIFRKES